MYFLCNHIYPILEVEQLKAAIIFASENSVSIEAKVGDDKQEERSTVVVQDTEDSRGEDRHTVQASAIAYDN